MRHGNTFRHLYIKISFADYNHLFHDLSVDPLAIRHRKSLTSMRLQMNSRRQLFRKPGQEIKTGELQNGPLSGTSKGNAGNTQSHGMNGSKTNTNGTNGHGITSDKSLPELKCDVCSLTFRYISDVYCHKPCVFKRRLSRVKDNMSRFYIQMRPTADPVKKSKQATNPYEPSASIVGPGLNEDEDVMVVSEGAKVGKILCDFCTFSFSNDTELQNHLTQTHLDMVDLSTDFGILYNNFVAKIKPEAARTQTNASASSRPKVNVRPNTANKRKESFVEANGSVSKPVPATPPKRSRRKQAIQPKSPI